jgi:hypothetical protein
LANSSRKDASLKPIVSQSELIHFPALTSKQLAKRCSMETLIEANQTSSIFKSFPQHSWRKDAPWKPYCKSINAHPSSNPLLITVGEKMLHGNPNGSQSELVYLPIILPLSQLAKRCSMETLMEANRAHPSSNPPLITVGEKMLHGNPIGSQSEFIHLPILPHHSWRKDAS